MIELGGALGIAVIGSVLTSGYRRSVERSDVLPEPPVEAIAGSAGAGLAIAALQEPGVAIAIVDTVRSGIADGLGQAMLVPAAIAAIGAVYVAARTPRSAGAPS